MKLGKATAKTTTLLQIVPQLLLLALFITPCNLVAQTSEPAPQLGSLKAIRVRKMDQKEYHRRIEDFIGATHSVRLRYEAPADHGVYVYLWFGELIDCLTIRRKGEAIRWLAGNEKDGFRSPGLPSKKHDPKGAWLYLPEQSVMEREYEIEPTAPGEQEAKSIFVKRTRASKPIELISNWYSTSNAEVPAP